MNPRAISVGVYTHKHRNVSYMNMHTLHKNGRTIKFSFCHRYLPGIIRILTEKYLIDGGDVFKLLEVLHHFNDKTRNYITNKYGPEKLEERRTFRHDKHFKFASVFIGVDNTSQASFIKFCKYDRLDGIFFYLEETDEVLRRFLEEYYSHTDLDCELMHFTINYCLRYAETFCPFD